MKSAINITLGFLVYGIVGGMEMNSIGVKTGLVSVMVIALVLCLINRKKSATSHTRNGQARKCHRNTYHVHSTPKEGGLSSGL